MIDAFLSVSKIHGIGLFAGREIKSGEVVWEFNKLLDLKFSEEEFDRLPLSAKRQFLHYCYHSKDHNYILCFDDARFLNHSDNPNLLTDDTAEGAVFAIKDIHKGEELTTNYNKFDVDYEKKMKNSFF